MRGKSIKLALSLVALAFLTSGFMSGHSHNHELCHGFVPENDMRIPANMFSTGGLTEQQFNQVIDRIESLYTAEVQAKGKKLTVKRLWSDATVNASAQQLGNDWVVNMYGGLARHAAVTEEGFALVACHEVGHHLGGAPKINGFLGMNSWATNEGGSDYFATLKCLRKYFDGADNLAFVNNNNIEQIVRNTCETQFASAEEQALCMRLSKAGESVAYLFQDLRKETVTPLYSTPDATIVKKTNDNHPQTQCRMDTYFAGFTCNAPVSSAQSDSDFKAGSCVEGTDGTGFRPRCWFQPDAPQAGDCPLGDPMLCELACQFSKDLPFCKSATSVFY